MFTLLTWFCPEGISYTGSLKDGSLTTALHTSFTPDRCAFSSHLDRNCPKRTIEDVPFFSGGCGVTRHSGRCHDASLYSLLCLPFAAPVAQNLTIHGFREKPSQGFASAATSSLSRCVAQGAPKQLLTRVSTSQRLQGLNPPTRMEILSPMVVAPNVKRAVAADVWLLATWTISGRRDRKFCWCRRYGGSFTKCMAIFPVNLLGTRASLKSVVGAASSDATGNEPVDPHGSQ